MAITTHKTQIGYEDIYWGSVAETFSRKTSTGGTLTLHKVPVATEQVIYIMTIMALDDDTTILHEWGGGKFHKTLGNGPDALGIIYKK